MRVNTHKQENEPMLKRLTSRIERIRSRRAIKRMYKHYQTPGLWDALDRLTISAARTGPEKEKIDAIKNELRRRGLRET